MLLFRHLPKLLTRLVRLTLFSFQRSNFVFRCRFDNYLIISAVWLEVNNFFRNLFFIFASCCCVSLTTSIYYHRFKKTSTVFLYFFQFILNIFFQNTFFFWLYYRRNSPNSCFNPYLTFLKLLSLHSFWFSWWSLLWLFIHYSSINIEIAVFLVSKNEVLISIRCKKT